MEIKVTQMSPAQIGLRITGAGADRFIKLTADEAQDLIKKLQHPDQPHSDSSAG